MVIFAVRWPFNEFQGAGLLTRESKAGIQSRELFYAIGISCTLGLLSTL